MTHSEKKKKLPGKQLDPADKKLRVIKAAIRIGEKGRFQQVEIVFYGNPFKLPVMIRKPELLNVRPLKPVRY